MIGLRYKIISKFKCKKLLKLKELCRMRGTKIAPKTRRSKSLKARIRGTKIVFKSILFFRIQFAFMLYG